MYRLFIPYNQETIKCKTDEKSVRKKKQKQCRRRPPSLCVCPKCPTAHQCVQCSLHRSQLSVENCAKCATHQRSCHPPSGAQVKRGAQTHSQPWKPLRSNFFSLKRGGVAWTEQCHTGKRPEPQMLNSGKPGQSKSDKSNPYKNMSVCPPAVMALFRIWFSRSHDLS